MDGLRQATRLVSASSIFLLHKQESLILIVDKIITIEITINHHYFEKLIQCFKPDKRWPARAIAQAMGSASMDRATA